MAIATPTDQELAQATQDILRSVGNLTNFSEGSGGAMLLAVLTEAKRTVYGILEQAQAARDLETAQGADLDNIARTYGITRLPPTSAGASGNAAQVIFTNNGTATVGVPSGTGTFSTLDVSARFYTTTPLSLAPGTSGLTGVQGPSGEYHDVAPGALTAHNGDPRLSVVNVLPVSGGGGYETDEELRYRISTTLTAAVLGGPTSAQSIQNALQAQAGVKEAVLINPSPGLLNALIITTSGYTADDDFLTSMQEVMAGKAAAGITCVASAPQVLPVDVDIALTVAGGAMASSLRPTLTAVSEAYINTREPYVTATGDATILTPVSSIYDASVVYADLLAAITDAARATLGTSLQGVTLLLSTGAGQTALQGDVYPRSGQVARARATRLTVTAI